MVAKYLPEVVTYGYGNQNELKKVMRMKQNDVTPICWYELPDGDNTYPRHKDWMEVRVNLFFAVNTDKNMLNAERETETFGAILNPLTDKAIRMFTKSNNIDIDSDIVSNPIHNYHTPSDEQNKVFAYWDVRTLAFDAKIFNNECLNEIIF